MIPSHKPTITIEKGMITLRDPYGLIANGATLEQAEFFATLVALEEDRLERNQ